MAHEHGDEFTPVIRFRREDSMLYSDETVRLIDHSHADLIGRLHQAFSRFQTPGVIREPLKEKLEDTLYEEDYQKANARLVGMSWETLDLNTAAFLMGFSGCLGTREAFALIPFQLEILLRAEAWVWPFELFVAHLRKEPEDLFDFEDVYKDPELRPLIEDFLRTVKTKFDSDVEFNSGEGAVNLDQAIRDWV